MARYRGAIVNRYGEDRVQAFEIAAVQRQAEAEFLSTKDYNLAAIYFFGYATELRLKAACYRYSGYTHREPIMKEDRERVAAKARMFNLSPIGPHDLVGWSLLLAAFRRLRQPNAALPFNKSIVEKAEVVATFWAPQMRYRTTVVPRNDVDGVRAATEWFADHYAQIIPT